MSASANIHTTRPCDLRRHAPCAARSPVNHWPARRRDDVAVAVAPTDRDTKTSKDSTCNFKLMYLSSVRLVRLIGLRVSRGAKFRFYPKMFLFAQPFVVCASLFVHWMLCNALSRTRAIFSLATCICNSSFRCLNVQQNILLKG